MEKVDLDLAISRLLLGYQVIHIDDLEIKVVNPDIGLIHQANVLVKNLYIKNKYRAFSKYKLEKDFILRRVLDFDYKEKIEKMHKGLDNLKFELFKAGPLIEQAKKIRSQLAVHKKNIATYTSDVETLFYYSIENAIERSKLYYLYIKTAFVGDEPLFSEDAVDYSLLNKVLEQIQINAFTITQLRFIARSAEWRSYWNVSKENVFKQPLYDLSEDQRLLCSLSSMYDDALANADFPRRIMDDDDLFDGWKIHMHRKFEDSQKEQGTKKIGSEKFYQNRFIQATTEEEANNIYELNGSYAQEILRQRSKELAEKKEVRLFSDQLRK